MSDYLNLENYCYYDEKKFNPENLETAPEVVKETVYNICRFLYDGWDTSNGWNKKKFEKLVNFFKNPDKILMDILVLKEEDIKNIPVLVLQIATFRFLHVHLPQIFDTLEKENWTNQAALWNSSSLLKQVKLEEWEKPFWLVAAGQNLRIGYEGERLNPFCEKKREGEKHYNILDEPVKFSLEFGKKCYEAFSDLSGTEKNIREKIINSAMKHKEIIGQIRQLQQEYEIYAAKMEKFNHAAKQYTREEKEERLAVVQRMREVITVLEKNISGELLCSDIAELQNNLPEWEKAADILNKTVNELF